MVLCVYLWAVLQTTPLTSANARACPTAREHANARSGAGLQAAGLRRAARSCNGHALRQEERRRTDAAAAPHAGLRQASVCETVRARRTPPRFPPHAPLVRLKLSTRRPATLADGVDQSWGFTSLANHPEGPSPRRSGTSPTCSHPSTQQCPPPHNRTLTTSTPPRPQTAACITTIFPRAPSAGRLASHWHLAVAPYCAAATERSRAEGGKSMVPHRASQKGRCSRVVARGPVQPTRRAAPMPDDTAGLRRLLNCGTPARSVGPPTLRRPNARPEAVTRATSDGGGES